MSDSEVTGVASGFLLLPAREYKWELKTKVEFRLPLEGKIGSILNKSELALNTKVAGEDEFSIFDDNLLLLWELVRVMFASSKYPQLEDHECLNVVALEFIDNEVVVYGEVIKSVE